MFTTRLRALSVFVVLAAAGSGLLLAQSPQAVGTWVGVGAADNPFGNGASVALTDGRTLIVSGAGPDERGHQPGRHLRRHDQSVCHCRDAAQCEDRTHRDLAEGRARARHRRDHE